MKMQESGEMYLETILVLSENLSEVRSIDIACELGYSKPSVSRAIKLLKADGYITIEDGGSVKLTASGEKIAKKIFERHEVLRDVLVSIGVDEITASQDACRIEHVISQESFDKIKNYFSLQPSLFT